ncbi:MAG: type II toxin-antitoxin system VapC family toxin [Casimicrobiaceae bacterium]
MIALLDTHSFLWAAIEPRKLSARARAAIENSANEIHVSTVSFWEIALKFALGKLKLAGCMPDDLVSIAREMRLEIAAPTAEEAAGFYRLPKKAHKDPFDRMLIWMCMQRRWTFFTKDAGLEDYRALGLETFW